MCLDCHMYGIPSRTKFKQYSMNIWVYSRITWVCGPDICFRNTKHLTLKYRCTMLKLQHLIFGNLNSFYRLAYFSNLQKMCKVFNIKTIRVRGSAFSVKYEAND